MVAKRKTIKPVQGHDTHPLRLFMPLQPVMAYFMRCCRTIRSQKEQAAHPLRGQQAESIC